MMLPPNFTWASKLLQEQRLCPQSEACTVLEIRGRKGKHVPAPGSEVAVPGLFWKVFCWGSGEAGSLSHEALDSA